MFLLRKSGSRAYRSYNMDSGRAKRDLDIDPEDWLALMTIVEAERKQKAHEQSRHVQQRDCGYCSYHNTHARVDDRVQIVIIFTVFKPLQFFNYFSSAYPQLL